MTPSLQDIVIVSAKRTPIGKFGGSLLPLSPAELGVAAAKAAIAEARIDAKLIDQTIFGHGRQAGGKPNTARQVGHFAGVAQSSPAFTVNMACASGLKSVVLAAQAILMGEANTVLAGGTESMSNTPYLLLNARWGQKLGHQEIVDAMYRDGFQCPLCDQLMGKTAETLAQQYGISRREQDEFAVESQKRASAAAQSGRFDAEKIPVTLQIKKEAVAFNTDEHVRADATVDGMAKLPPVFDANGTVHAGNSSGITDGAAALIVMHKDTAKAHGLAPMARLRAAVAVGVDPAIMGIGPVPAVRQLLDKTGLQLKDIDLIELNEAFAAQVLACDRELKFDRSRLNVNGGAIALGHPIGATGARISVTLLHEMRKRNARLGLATLCVSGGMGIAVLFENIA